MSDFLPVLTTARDVDGAKLAVHLGEIPNQEEVEKCLSILRPDRVGHATHLHPKTAGGSEKAMKLLDGAPVEICLTSNMWCRSVPSLEEHHVRHLHEDRPGFIFGQFPNFYFRMISMLYFGLD